MKSNRPVSTNIINPDMMSPDERQDFNDTSYVDAIKSDVRAQDRPPLPHEDPRDPLPGQPGQTYGSFDQGLAEEGTVKRYAEDLARADYTRYALGYNDANDYMSKHGQSQYEGAGKFLLDTFKRARETGYPIHPLMPYLDTMASSTFSDQGYEDKADN